MRRIIVLLMMVLMLSGCVVLEAQRYVFVKREPVEESEPAPVPVNGDEAWYAILVEIAGTPVAIVHEVFAGVANLADSIGGSIVQIRKGVVEEKVTYTSLVILDLRKEHEKTDSIIHEKAGADIKRDITR